MIPELPPLEPQNIQPPSNTEHRNQGLPNPSQRRDPKAWQPSNKADL